MGRTLFRPALALAAFAVTVPSVDALQYRVTVVGIPPNQVAGGTTGINDAGLLVVTGNRNTWLWKGPDRWAPLGEFLGSRFEQVNRHGEFSLNGFLTDRTRPYYWSEARGAVEVSAPFSPAGPEAFRNNDLGQIAATASGSGKVVGYVWSPDGAMVVVPLLPGHTGNTAWGLNNRGTVVGNTEGPAGSSPYRWTPGSDPVLIPPPPGSTTSRRAFQVTDDGAVYGWDGFGAVGDPWVLFPGETVPLRVRGSTDAGWDTPGKVNQLGHLVGVQRGAPVGRKATLWIPGWSRGRDLRSMVDSSVGDWGFAGAYCVNNKGQVGVAAEVGDGPRTPLLLTPHSLVSPVGSLAARAGRVESGGTAQLLEEDGAFVRARRGLSPTSIAAPLALEASATVAERPLYLWVRATLRSADGAPLAVRARLWDWVEGRWDSDPFRSDAWAVGGEWSRNELVARRDPGARYRGPLGEVRVRLDATGPPTAPWALDLDRLDVEWVARPPD